MYEDLFSVKHIMTVISTVLTFILGIVGYHYKGFVDNLNELDKKVDKLEVIAHEHNVHVTHFNETIRKIENKLDYLLHKLDEIK